MKPRGVPASSALLSPRVTAVAGSLVASAFDKKLPLALDIVSGDGAAQRVDRWRPDSGRWAGACAGISVACTTTPCRGGTTISIVLTSTSGEPVVLRGARLSLATAALRPAGANVAALRLAYCGAHSRSDESRSYATPLAVDDRVAGWWVGALASTYGAVLGAIDYRVFATSVEHRRDEIAAYQHLEQRRLGAADSVALAPMWLAITHGRPFDALEAFADEVAAVHGASPPMPKCGWGTWGHFFEEIDAGLLRETVTTLGGLSGISDAIQVVQIDDGWSEMLASGRVSASWRPNRRFPSGIAPLAAEIVSTGRDCGLWMIPFTVNEGSTLAAEHPELLVHGADGRPLRAGGGTSYCIDPTHPDAAEWLTDLFAEVRDWGVRYVKLDFLRGLLAPEPMHSEDGVHAPRRYSGAGTRVQAYRRGLEVIRETMGPDTHLLGCSAPAGPGAGLVSAHRVGPDIEPHWIGKNGGVRDAARAVAANWFWNRRVWVNDPDYVIPCESEDVTRFWAAIVALSGGSMILSADLAEMEGWIESLFSFIAPPIGIAARPLDLFENGPEPRVWQLPLAKDGKAWQVIGLFNWSDRPRELALDLAQLGFGDEPVHLWDIFRRRHRVETGATTVFAEPRSVVLLRATSNTGEPTVIGTDVHFGQGWLEVASEQWNRRAATLTLLGAHRAGFAYVWSCTPPVAGGVASERHGAGIVRVPLTPDVRSTVKFAARVGRAKSSTRSRHSHSL